MSSRSRRPCRMVIRAAWVPALLLLGIWIAEPATAQRIQDRPNAAEADRAIDQLRSPYCPGFMLRVCTSGQAALLRDSIYELAARGMSSTELVEWMIAGHGEEWRAVPQRSGAGLWAWVVPPAAVLLAVFGIAGWLRTNRARADDSPADEATEISDSDRRELTAALRDWEALGEEGM